MDACVPSVKMILEMPCVIWGWGNSTASSFLTAPSLRPIVHPSSPETSSTPGPRSFGVLCAQSNTAAATPGAPLLPAGSTARWHVCLSSCPLTESQPSAPRVKIPPSVHAHLPSPGRLEKVSPTQPGATWPVEVANPGRLTGFVKETQTPPYREMAEQVGEKYFFFTRT